MNDDMTRAPRRGQRRTLRAGALLAVFGMTVIGLGAGAGVAQADEGESIASFDSAIDVDKRGDLHIVETIQYVFAGADHHGLRRELRTAAGPTGVDQQRVYEITDITAASPSGAPAGVTVTDAGGSTTIRVGDLQQTVSGRQTYVLRYTVARLAGRDATATGRRDDLYWNVTGAGWDVPIDRVSVRVTAPQSARAFSCFRGKPGSSTPCAGVAGPISTFSASGLPPYQGLSFVLGFPQGTFAEDGTRPYGGWAAGVGMGGQNVGAVLLVVLIGGFAALARGALRKPKPKRGPGSRRSPAARSSRSGWSSWSGSGSPSSWSDYSSSSSSGSSDSGSSCSGGGGGSY